MFATSVSRIFPSEEGNFNCPIFADSSGKLRDELLNCEIFETLFEAKVLIERWRKEYNTFRPHSVLGYLPPAPETVEAKQTVSATLQLSV
jgi:transposase InsO family protein